MACPTLAPSVMQPRPASARDRPETPHLGEELNHFYCRSCHTTTPSTPSSSPPSHPAFDSDTSSLLCHCPPDNPDQAPLVASSTQVSKLPQPSTTLTASPHEPRNPCTSLSLPCLIPPRLPRSPVAWILYRTSCAAPAISRSPSLAPCRPVTEHELAFPGLENT